jgi:glutamate 5-kinase
MDPPLAPATAVPRRVVVKIGTNSLVDGDRLAVGVIAQLVEACVALQAKGLQVVVVSSGAVGVGCQTLNVKVRPTKLSEKQALAAVGQIRLMRMYDDLFQAVGTSCAQVLLSFDNLSQRETNRNAKNTFDALLSMGVVPIVNENDTVATQELKFGDNDRLSAMVAAMIGADWLFLLTDVDGVYTANPKTTPNARRLTVVRDVDDLASLVDTGDGAGSVFSTGGMATKLAAARLASAAGAKTVIMRASQPTDMLKVMATDDASDGSRSSGGDESTRIGTVIMPRGDAIRRDRKRWIVGLRPEGVIYVNEGAARALSRKKSLFSAGVVDVRGQFGEMSCVSIRLLRDENGDGDGGGGGGVSGDAAAIAADAMACTTSTSSTITKGQGGAETRRGAHSRTPPPSGELEIALALVNYTSEELQQIRGCHSDAIASTLGTVAVRTSEIAHRTNIVLCRTGDF